MASPERSAAGANGAVDMAQDQDQINPTTTATTTTTAVTGTSDPEQGEKRPSYQNQGGDGDELLNEEQVGTDLNVTQGDLREAQEVANRFTLEEIRPLLTNVLRVHEHDPNFPFTIVQRIQAFLRHDDVFVNPEKHAVLIEEMKLEAALITVNSPYAEVRAVVDNHDDPSEPCSTLRAWAIGAVFNVLLSFINQLFQIRQPSIGVQTNVVQLLAWPVGQLCSTLPDWGFTFWGVRHSINPGPFNKKEHMLITILANAAGSPYTNNIIWVQYLPTYFNQSYAGEFAYQTLLGLATNFIGYGMAGLMRRFLVYPSYCMWPASLVTIALNASFHTGKNTAAPGPWGRVFTASRLRFFTFVFVGMFVYFWLPNFLFGALSIFSWMTWIAPSNVNLAAITGMNNGLGINPWPTFDWNIVSFDGTDPLMIPFFSTLNKFLGACLSAGIIAALWYTNTYNTGYLPINSNRVYDNKGHLYNVSRAVDAKGLFDRATYEAYSPPFLAAGNLVVYLFFFAIYSATVSYAYLYHRHEIAMGFRNLINSYRKKKKGDDEDAGVAGEAHAEYQYQDVHNRLMAAYPEVPEWWYTLVMLAAIGCGCAGIAAWDTYTTPGVVFYGLLLCAVFVIPVGIIKAMTGIEVTLNVLAEFIGGCWVPGNALAMNFFKSFGYVTCAHALAFSNDMKLAHYVKIPPRHTFAAQMLGTLVSTFVSVGILNFQMNNIPGVCTLHAANRFTCPGINTFFTASVLWGTVGPVKVFGHGGLYTALLAGFPIGLAVPFLFAYAQRRWPSPWIRQLHPVALFYGALTWAPYNLSYVWPAVPIGWLSWIWLKKRYLELWSKYNFVLSAALSTGVAVAGIVIFFSLQWAGVEVRWWGNDVVSRGCEGTPCVWKTLQEGDYFGPRIGNFH